MTIMTPALGELYGAPGYPQSPAMGSTGTWVPPSPTRGPLFGLPPMPRLQPMQPGSWPSARPANVPSSARAHEYGTYFHMSSMPVPTVGTRQKSFLPVPTAGIMHKREREDSPAGVRGVHSPLAVTTAGDTSTMAGDASTVMQKTPLSAKSATYHTARPYKPAPTVSLKYFEKPQYPISRQPEVDYPKPISSSPYTTDDVPSPSLWNRPREPIEWWPKWFSFSNFSPFEVRSGLEFLFYLPDNIR